jgi:steroid 5-alpha reductase family enzyme
MFEPIALVSLLLGSALVLLTMRLTFNYGQRIDNYSVVDATWSVNFCVLALCYALLSSAPLSHRLLLALPVSIWSLRLAWHLHWRIHGKPEEGRYVDLRRRWSEPEPAAFVPRMRRFYRFQAYSNVILSLPMWLVCQNQQPQVTTLEWIGAAIMLMSVLGEALADAQLNAFKADPNRTERVCERGLWNYSRHPNYFFEWIFWVGLSCQSLAVGLWGLTGPVMAAIMLYLLLRVTGIKATEAQALRSKGEAYRRYQQTTSSFVPWFKKTSVS